MRTSRRQPCRQLLTRRDPARTAGPDQRRTPTLTPLNAEPDKRRTAGPVGVDTATRYRQDDRAWVAADDADVPAAYLIAGIVDGSLHIEQVSVHPRAVGRNIGRMLLVAVTPSGGSALTA